MKSGLIAGKAGPEIYLTFLGFGFATFTSDNGSGGVAIIFRSSASNFDLSIFALSNPNPLHKPDYRNDRRDSSDYPTNNGQRPSDCVTTAIGVGYRVADEAKHPRPNRDEQPLPPRKH